MDKVLVPLKEFDNLSFEWRVYIFGPKGVPYTTLVKRRDSVWCLPIEQQHYVAMMLHILFR